MLRDLNFLCRMIRPEAGVILVPLSWRGKKNPKNKKQSYRGSEGEPGDSKYN